MNSRGLGYLCNALRLCNAMLSKIVRRFPCVAWLILVQVAASVIILSRWQSVIVTKQLPSVIRDQLVSERQIYAGDGLNFTQTTDERFCLKNFLENYSKYCRTSIVAPEERGAGNSIGRFKEATETCPCLPENLRRCIAT